MYHRTSKKKRLSLAAGPGFSQEEQVEDGTWECTDQTTRPGSASGSDLQRSDLWKQTSIEPTWKHGIPTDTLPKFTFLVLTRYGYILVRNHDGERRSNRTEHRDGTMTSFIPKPNMDHGRGNGGFHLDSFCFLQYSPPPSLEIEVP